MASSILRVATVGLCALGLLITLEKTADAFCRSTTCRTKAKQECPADSDGCVTEGAKLFWPTSCIGYAMNRLGTEDADPEETRQVVKKTFQAWSDVECPDGTTAA